MPTKKTAKDEWRESSLDEHAKAGHMEANQLRKAGQAAGKFATPEKQELLRIFLQAINDVGGQANKAWTFSVQELGERFEALTAKLGSEIDPEKHPPFKKKLKMGNISSLLQSGGLELENPHDMTLRGDRGSVNIGKFYDRVTVIAEENDLEVKALLPKTLRETCEALKASGKDIIKRY